MYNCCGKRVKLLFIFLFVESRSLMLILHCFNKQKRKAKIKTHTNTIYTSNDADETLSFRIKVSFATSTVFYSNVKSVASTTQDSFKIFIPCRLLQQVHMRATRSRSNDRVRVSIRNVNRWM